MTMERGKLLISKTKKGFRAEILRERNQRKIPVKTTFTNDKWNGQIILFDEEEGDVIKIVSESGDVIYEKKVAATSNQSSSHGKTQSMQPKSQELPDSFDLAKTRLPCDVRDLSITDIDNFPDNFALKLNKAARYDEKDEKFKFFHKGTKKEDISYEIHPNFGDINLQDILERQKTHTDALCGNNSKILTFSPDWRLIIGIGSESVYETSITLHHVYGIPYIPASAIKGVTRNYAISEKFDNDENKALKCKDFCDIFGSDDKSYDGKAREGKIIFFDAFPKELGNQSIKVDIMNVHYSEYYNGEKSPTDTQNPIPIPFLTVENTPFQFIIGMKKSQNGLLDKAVEYLKNALEQHGIGAKTAVGYGYGQTSEVK